MSNTKNQTLWMWLNGAMHKQEDARLSASGAGLLLGEGVFTTIGVWHGRPLALDRHLARLRRDGAALDIALPWSDGALQEGLEEVLRRNAIKNGHARLTATARGDGRWNLDTGCDLSILARPHDATPDNSAPLRLSLSPFRLDARRPLAGVKSTSYAAHAHIWHHARRRGFGEALVCNSQGAVCEAARANVFWVRQGVLQTPAPQTGCLPGIAREIVLEWAADNEVTCRQGAFSLFDLAAADEVFLTAATSAPRVVQSLAVQEADAVNEKEYSTVEYSFEAPGPLTQRLQEHWQRMIAAL